MPKIKEAKKPKNNFIFLLYLGFGGLLLGIFLLLSPFGQRLVLDRGMGTLRQYLAEVEINKETFNIQQWWRLREQVDEGAWSLNERAVTFATTYKIYALPDGKTTLFSYETDRIRATESVIHKDQTKSYLENITGIKASIHTDNLIIDTFNNGDKRVVYVGEIDEMKEVVGFFDYTGEEMELLEGLVWLSETWLQTET